MNTFAQQAMEDSNNQRPVVLMIDDEAEFLEVAMEVLKSVGYDCVAAPDGAAALTLIHNGLRPGAILIDYRMPGLTGPEVLREIRETGCKSPAALVSAIQEDELAKCAHEFDDSLRKPFMIQELLQLLQRLIQKQRDDLDSTEVEIST